MFDTTPRLNDFNEAHRTCFDSFLLSHDIIELRNGGQNGVRISLKQINSGNSTQFFFGENDDLTSVVIDGNNNHCSEQNEITSSIIIQNGRIIESECKGKFTYIKLDHFIIENERFQSHMIALMSLNNTMAFFFPDFDILWFLFHLKLFSKSVDFRFHR